MGSTVCTKFHIEFNISSLLRFRISEYFSFSCVPYERLTIRLIGNEAFYKSTSPSNLKRVFVKRLLTFVVIPKSESICLFVAQKHDKYLKEYRRNLNQFNRR